MVKLLPPPVQATARSARQAADAAVQTGTRAAVELATAGGARIAKAADRAGPSLDRLDDALLPAAGDALEGVARAAAAVTRAAVGQALRLAVRLRLLTPPPRRAAGDPAGATVAPSATAPSATMAAPAPPAGRGVLERGARFVVLGLVAMIVFSTAAALLGFGSPPENFGVTQPAATPSPTPAAGLAAANAVPQITIGPYPGDSSAFYVSTADNALAEYAKAAPDADLLAVVSLEGYQTAAAAHTVFSQYRVTRVFFAAPATGTVHSAAVQDPVADVLTAFRAQADTDAAAASTATSQATRAQANTEERALRADCACVFAAVVRAPAARLVALRANPAVRVVDAAPPGTLDNAVTFVPIAPGRG